MVIGLLNFIRLTGIIHINYETSYFYFLQFIGLVFVMTSLGKNYRGMLFLGAALFMTGITLFIINQFEILSPVKILLPSILVITGTGFFMLYIDNTKENVFLMISIILFTISLLLIRFTGKYQVINQANRIAYTILEFWPVLLALLGVGILANRNRRW